MLNVLGMLGTFFDVRVCCDSRTLPKLTQALRSQTRSVSRTQQKLKIFENSSPRQLLKLACTGLHLQCLIVLDALHDKDEDGK